VSLKENITSVQERIASAAERAGRSAGDITLIAVSKAHDAAEIEQAFEYGLRDFGENRVQELIKKHEQLSTRIHWHLVGHLQSNKAKYIAPFVHLVHSIDSIETAKELGKRAEQASRVVDVLIEVNIAHEPTKHGVLQDQADPLLCDILENTTNLRVRGLMTVAPYEAYPENTRPYFRALRHLRDRIGSRYPDLSEFNQLSMGMTNDFEIAIEEGATIVRIGTAIFGERELCL
jgi:pyridoxal phosphate enzyme (YggS family)